MTKQKKPIQSLDELWRKIENQLSTTLEQKVLQAVGALKDHVDDRMDRISDRLTALEIQQQAKLVQSTGGQYFSAAQQMGTQSSASPRSDVRIRGIF